MQLRRWMRAPLCRLVSGLIVIGLVLGAIGCGGGGPPSQAELQRRAKQMRAARDEKGGTGDSASAEQSAPSEAKQDAAARQVAKTGQSEPVASESKPKPAVTAAPSGPPGGAGTAASGASPAPTPDAANSTPPVGTSLSGEIELKPVQKPDQPLSETETRQRTIDNLRQIAAAMKKYVEKNNRLPMAAINMEADSRAAPIRPLLSWRVELLPYLGHEALYKRFKLDEPWDDDHNLALLPLIPAVYQSPDRFDEKTNYLAVTGSGTAFPQIRRGLAAEDIPDGMEHTLLIVEVDDEAAVPWTQPSEHQITHERPHRRLGRLRSDGFFAIWGNASVNRVPSSVTPVSLFAATTIDGGEGVRRGEISVPAKAERHLKTTDESVADDDTGKPEKSTASPVASSRGEPAEVTRHPRMPVPERDALQRAMTVFREVYKSEYEAAKDHQAKQLLAKKLLEKARQMAGDAGGQFVLLQVARRVAAEGADVSTALDAANETVKAFEVDELAVKAEVLETLTRQAKWIKDHARMLEEAEAMLDRSVLRDDYKAADILLAAATIAVRGLEKNTRSSELTINRKQRDAGSKDGDQAKTKTRTEQLAGRKREVEAARAAHRGVEKVLQQLDQDPNDPQSNRAVGEYFCLVKGQWEQGLVMLARGDRDSLRALASFELEQPQTAERRVDLADGWWDLGDKTPRHRKQLRLHAVEWYARALPELPEGLLKVKAEMRIADTRRQYGDELTPSARPRL